MRNYLFKMSAALEGSDAYSQQWIWLLTNTVDNWNRFSSTMYHGTLWAFFGYTLYCTLPIATLYHKCKSEPVASIIANLDGVFPAWCDNSCRACKVAEGRGSSTRLPRIFFSLQETFSLKPIRIEIQTERWATKRETVFDNAQQQIDCTCQLLHNDQSHYSITSMSITNNS